MPFKLADVQKEYEKNKELRKEDVEVLRQWAEKQPHLPPISELQLVMFLQSCYFSIEAAKSATDAFFTMKTHCPEFFANRDLRVSPLLTSVNNYLATPLPKLTPEGYRVFYCRMIDADIGKFVFTDEINIFDMNVMLSLMREGTDKGTVTVVDLHKYSFAHMAKTNVMSLKKVFYYLQEAMPVRLKSLHFVNTVSFMDKLMAMMKPFLKVELLDCLYLHATPGESLYKFVPKENLPKDLGGEAGSFQELHETMKQKLLDNINYFIEDEKQTVDESKRPGKPKTSEELFGVEGSFKKLDID